MAYTFEQLNSMTVAELRQIADGIENEAVKGHVTMHKEKLVPAICKALGLEAHAHHLSKDSHKGIMKLEIRKLKQKRTEATAQKNYVELKNIRQRIHNLKGKLRRSMA